MNLKNFSILTILAVSSCKQAEPAPKQYLECYVRHDASIKQTKAEATLREGEKEKKQVDFKGGIRYQRAEMRLVPIQGVTYRYEYPADFMPEHLYEWKNPEGATQAFTMGMNEVKDFTFGSDKISRNKPAKLKFDGKGLEQGETLVVMWENLKDGNTVPVQLYTTYNTTAVDFPAVKMKELSAGKWSVYLVRRKLSKANVGNVEATGVTEFYSKLDTINIIE